jgi:hypothetical protein
MLYVIYMGKTLLKFEILNFQVYILWFFKVLKFHIFHLIVETIVQPPKT